MSRVGKLSHYGRPIAGPARLRLDGDTAAWLVSFAVHAAALVLLAYCTLLLPADQRVLLSALPVGPEQQPAPQDVHFATDPQDEVGALGDAGLDDARPQAVVEASESHIAYEMELPVPIGELRVLEFDRTILEGPNVTANLLVKGAGSVGTAGAAGAVDRITHEIVLSLEQSPTLVAWLFDQSGSLKAERESIARRFDRVYEELGVIEAAGNPAFRRHRDKPLLTAVASFGASIQMLTRQPTDELAEIQASVRSISDDATGTENVFQAVGYIADKYRRYRLGSPRRNVMIVVFTDEAGDDIQALDAAVHTCRTWEIPVYVVGVPAPFGREQAYVKYVDPDPSFDQSPQWVPVRQGPESLLPERIKLLAPGQRQYDDTIDSGFGPFGLCRLAYETGGLYFTVHPNREVGRPIRRGETAAMSSHLGAFFDPRVMRPYRPDYVSAGQYRQMLSENRACAALVEAARLSWTMPMEDVRLRFPKIDDSQLARDLSLAQRAAAKLEPQINRLVETLRQGEVDRAKMTKPRWQAGFDLAIGRALAVQVRTEGYNTMLAEAKQGMRFRDERNDTWVLRPANDVAASSALAKIAAEARTYLEGVVRDHEGTPWALIATEELRRPLGWAWGEAFSDVAGQAARTQTVAGNSRPRPRPAGPPPKPRRDPPAL